MRRSESPAAVVLDSEEKRVPGDVDELRIRVQPIVVHDDRNRVAVLRDRSGRSARRRRRVDRIAVRIDEAVGMIDGERDLERRVVERLGQCRAELRARRALVHAPDNHPQRGSGKER